MNNQGGRLNELDTLIMDYKDIGESSNGINKYLPKYNPKKGKNIVYDLMTAGSKLKNLEL